MTEPLLKLELPNNDKKVIRETEMTETVFLKKLFDACGSYAKVGRLIGMSQTNVKKCIDMGVTRITTELAARWCLDQLEIEKHGAMKIALIKCPANYVETLSGFLEKINGKLALIEEEKTNG